MLASIDFLPTSNAKLVNIFVVKNYGNYKDQVHELKEQIFNRGILSVSTLIIHQVKTKKITTVKVSIPGLNLTILPLHLLHSFCFDWEDISNTRDSVSSAIQTPGISSKILRCAISISRVRYYAKHLCQRKFSAWLDVQIALVQTRASVNIIPLTIGTQK